MSSGFQQKALVPFKKSRRIELPARGGPVAFNVGSIYIYNLIIGMHYYELHINDDIIYI